MGLTRQYLRYVPQSTFGIIGSTNGQVAFINRLPNSTRPTGTNGRFVAVTAVEDVLIWDSKTGEKVNVFKSSEELATALVVNNECGLIACGYLDGTINIFGIETGELKVKFSGHKSAVNSLCFDNNGMKLASGGKDTELVIWDVISEAGLFRLKGHKHAITKVLFMKNHDIVITSSKDTFIKLWNLTTQHCFMTLTGHRSEVWDFVILNDDSRLISGASDGELKVWGIAFKDEEGYDDLVKNKQINEAQEGDEEEPNEDEENTILSVFREGSILRKSVQRLSNIYVDSSERVLICHGIDTNIEVFKIRTEQEINLALSKKAEKQRKKLKRKKEQDEAEEEESNVTIAPTLADEFERLEPLKTKSKVKHCSLFVTRDQCKICCLLSNNSIEFYSLSIKIKSASESIGSLSTGSHRSDVRTVSFSSDNMNILSASPDSIKIWNRSTQTCITSITGTRLAKFARVL